MTTDKELIRSWLKKNVAPDQNVSMIEHPPPATRLELVRVWLEDNVVCPPTPKEITVHSIEFDWNSLSGTFRLVLDDCEIAEPFKVGMDLSGRVQFTPPMFWSPLGAPASYAAVELDEVTVAAVMRALASVFPRLRGYGIYPDLGLEIYGDNPLGDRIIDFKEFGLKSALLASKNFKVRYSLAAAESVPNLSGVT
jgi:hypothetical protein